MSLVAFALRTVFVELVRGQTWAGDNVIDSPLDPVATAIARSSDIRKPCVVVYSGEGVNDVGGMQAQGVSARQTLLVYIYLPPSTATVESGGEQFIEIDTRNEGGAATLDVVSTQVRRAFEFGPEPWLAIWKKIVLSIQSVRARPVLVEFEKQPVMPCLEIEFVFSTIPDGPFGRPLFGAWQMLHDAMHADAELQPFAGVVKAMVEAPGEAVLPDWRIAQIHLGVSQGAIKNSGLTEPEGGVYWPPSDPDA